MDSRGSHYHEVYAAWQPATIDDPAILNEIESALKVKGVEIANNLRI